MLIVKDNFSIFFSKNIIQYLFLYFYHITKNHLIESSGFHNLGYEFGWLTSINITCLFFSFDFFSLNLPNQQSHTETTLNLLYNLI